MFRANTGYCAYCRKSPDGPMLVMGRSWAHAECVIRKLNELLDPEWEDSCGRLPEEIVGFLWVRNKEKGNGN